jgi:hypothetical protein
MKRHFMIILIEQAIQQANLRFIYPIQIPGQVIASCQLKTERQTTDL